MAKAILNGVAIAESDATVVVEGNHYFPPDAVDWEKLQASETQSRCPWKGLAHYYDVVIGDERRSDAAWAYPDPSEAAKEIKDHVAFWNGIQVQE